MRSAVILRALLLLACAGGAPTAAAQSPDSLTAGPAHAVLFGVRSSTDTSFVLPNAFIIPGSERIALDSAALRAGADYRLDPRSGILTIPRLRSMLRDSLPHRLAVRYRSLPFTFQRAYRLREPVVRLDTVTGRSITVARPSGGGFSIDDLFGSNLQKSGSIVRGFSAGSNRDLSLSSGFRMQMAGAVTNDIQVVAALTDENSPIQPEGTTQTLQEIDKVFVEIRGPRARATLGDFTFSRSGTEFGGITRKLQGATGTYEFAPGGEPGEVTVTGAGTRGKFFTNAFTGLDGVQGPYRLTGGNNERAIIVIAGTERVYVDGVRMTRGETNDYTIDYGNAEITFTPRRLVTRASRLTVDFEYTDRQFNRTLLAAGASGTLGILGVTAAVVSEKDDASSPVEASFTQEDLDTLAAAGDNPQRAARAGAAFAGPGKGQYVFAGNFRDSLRHVSVPVYRFDPADTVNAVYAVAFSYVGEGNGYYRKISVVQYAFDSLRGGNYAPVRFLPLPESHQLVDVALNAKAGERLTVTGEYAVSRFDPNELSPLGDDAHAGPAFNAGLALTGQPLSIGGSDAGLVDLSLRERYVDARFVPLDRTNDVDFNRIWNASDSVHGDEELHEGKLTYRPRPGYALTGEYGGIRRGDFFSSERAALEGSAAPEGLSAAAGYRADVIDTRDAAGPSTWLRQRGTLSGAGGVVRPSLAFVNELLLRREPSGDSTAAGSYRSTEISPSVTAGRDDGSSLSAGLSWLWDDSTASPGALGRASHTFMQRYAGALREWRSLTTTLDLTIRKRTFTEEFRRRGNADVSTILLRSQTRWTPVEGGAEGEWFYEVATERAPKEDVVFQRVPKGTGNYVYIGDANGNRVIDAGDFALSRFDGDYIAVTVPGDELVPVIDVKASTRVRLTASKLLAGGGWAAKLLSPLSTETYFRVEEESTDPDTKEIYLLRFSRFLRDATTILGSNYFSHDFYLWENDPLFNLRLRYSQQKGLTQFATFSERTYVREQSVRMRFQFVREIANEVNYAVRRDLLTANGLSSRIRGVFSETFSIDWAYRPMREIEVGFTLGTGDATNFDTTAVSLNSQALRFLYAFAGKGQARTSITREEAVYDRSTPVNAPFELTGGRREGKSWLWQAGFDYQVTKLLQVSAGYDGRSEGGAAAVHTARAEVRALF